MLAHIQKLLATLWIGSAIAWLSWSIGRVHPVTAVAGLIAIALAHSLVLAFEFVLVHRQHRDHPAHPVSIPLLMQAWFAESWIALRVFLWQQAFRSHAVPDDTQSVAGRRAVLMVHGYVCNRGFWNPWMRKLRASRIPYRAVTLEPPFGSIDDGIEAIDNAVRELTAATGHAPLVVAHSMGGLSVRAWMHARQADGRVHHVVTIASPHQGTALARYGSTTNAKQLRTDSAWLREMVRQEPPERYQRFTCFHGHCDNVVFPLELATLPGADNRHVAASAHIQMALRDEVFNEVIRLLNAPAHDAGSTVRRPDRAPD